MTTDKGRGRQAMMLDFLPETGRAGAGGWRLCMDTPLEHCASNGKTTLESMCRTSRQEQSLALRKIIRLINEPLPGCRIWIGRPSFILSRPGMPTRPGISLAKDASSNNSHNRTE